MKRAFGTSIAVLWLTACAAEPEPNLATTKQAIMQQQGTQLQGIRLQGQVSGMTMLGFQTGGALLNGAPLDHVRIDRGELVADQAGVTLRGTDLTGAHLFATVRNVAAIPAQIASVEYQITAIEPEDASYDPTHTGATYLYSLAQNVDGTGNWQSACGRDYDGRQAALPLTAYWDERGNRVASDTVFTFGCTTGVIAKCYRWGYRPWVGGYGDLISTHQACTRAARADYCGNGTSHTRDGTLINIWDSAPAPGPIQVQGTVPVTMLFEAGWNTSGAVCLSHARWLLNGPIIALGCPGRLLAPGLGLLGATVCDTTAQVLSLGQAGNAQIYDASNLNLNLDLL